MVAPRRTQCPIKPLPPRGHKRVPSFGKGVLDGLVARRKSHMQAKPSKIHPRGIRFGGEPSFRELGSIPKTISIPSDPDQFAWDAKERVDRIDRFPEGHVDHWDERKRDEEHKERDARV